ncbi:hypothetical protein Mal15_16990 [Stieleria maiorica]|uniref:Uncharacterized protein n=1 Tax=Stieleria maiorica TaxID=2795974 RepID=A0A5B9MEP1_9BACT|nr:hypothetical protein Mal15_16990 [Stieleria maiorica]
MTAKQQGERSVFQSHPPSGRPGGNQWNPERWVGSGAFSDPAGSLDCKLQTVHCKMQICRESSLKSFRNLHCSFCNFQSLPVHQFSTPPTFHQAAPWEGRVFQVHPPPVRVERSEGRALSSCRSSHRRAGPKLVRFRVDRGEHPTPAASYGSDRRDARGGKRADFNEIAAKSRRRGVEITPRLSSAACLGLQRSPALTYLPASP